jgi:hypothetical protein
MPYHSPFLSLFLQFHRVDPLLQTCSSSEFVCDHGYFVIHVYLLDLSSMYERKHVAFVFLSLAYFTWSLCMIFLMLLSSVCQYFVENLCIYIH